VQGDLQGHTAAAWLMHGSTHVWCHLSDMLVAHLAAAAPRVLPGDLEGPLRGIIPRSIEDIFCQIQNDPEPSSRCGRGATLC
jgi:hypothetical protein